MLKEMILNGLLPHFVHCGTQHLYMNKQGAPHTLIVPQARKWLKLPHAQRAGAAPETLTHVFANHES